MRRMSFALTKEQVRNQTKTVTRRRPETWIDLVAGDLLQPVEKAQGLRKGERQVLIGGPVQVTSVWLERLDRAGPDEPRLEGFPDMILEDFLALERKANGCQNDDYVRRIEFEYCEPLREQGEGR